jgi:hypothetical protein
VATAHRCTTGVAFRRLSQLATIGTAGIGIGSAVTMAGGGSTPLLAVVSTLATVVLHAVAKELRLI